ncbi:hypothetical protein SeLEV6574_g05746 [Synchytrium endobioticum]|uniref:PH domain-containing protein n=1 Tax=Synchytrium endobioticum TaxID=286115 RepID=A0A507CSK8_9FUNG|nr:hypothetical protein SeLEV6574_g05746 [Synchytrium endobioticum]
MTTCSPAAAADNGANPAKQFQLVEAFRLHANDPDSIIQAIKRYTSSHPNLPVPFGSPLHLAVSLSSKPVIDRLVSEYCCNNHTGYAIDAAPSDWVNLVNSEGETPVHLAARLGRADVIGTLLTIAAVDETKRDHQGRTPEESAKSLKVLQVLQSHRMLFCQEIVTRLTRIAELPDAQAVLKLFAPQTRAYSYLKAGWIDINGPLGPEDEQSLLHIAARIDDMQLVEWCSRNGADPKVKDKRGKTPADVAGREAKARLKHAICQAPILAASLAQATSSGKPLPHAGPPILRGTLAKWTNYASGYKTRYFVLENTSLSYFQSTADYPLSCRGSISMLIAKIVMPDHNDKSRFDVLGKGSVRYALKARSPAEAKKWVWALNESKLYATDRQRQGKGSTDDVSDTTREMQTFEEIDVAFGDVETEGSVAGDHVSISHQSDKSVSNRRSIEAMFPNTDADPIPPPPPPPPRRLSKKELDILSKENSSGNSQKDHPASPLPDLQTLVYLLNVHLDVQRRMVDSLVQAINQKPSDSSSLCTASNTSNTPKREETQDMDLLSIAALCQNSSARVSETVKQVITVCDERDRKWARRWRAEIDSRKRWEEIVKNFVGLDALTEEEMAHAGKDADHLGLVSDTPDRASNHESNSDHDEILSAVPDHDNEEADEDDVFYDAPGGDFLEQMFGFQPLQRSGTIQRKGTTGLMKTNRVTSSRTTLPRVSSPVAISKESLDGTIGLPVSIRRLLISLQELKTSAVGYPNTFRDRLPLDPKSPRPTLNVWSFMRSAIGKDLSKVTLPVFFNEPLSMLQRMAEDVEYVEILNFAARVGNHGRRIESLEGMHLGVHDPASIHAKVVGCQLKEVENMCAEEASLFRTMLVAAYAMSNYSSTMKRANKPFNPMLGETFELVRKDKWYRYFSEQTAHHPPVCACHCESPDYVFWTEVNVKSKFWGRSLELHPLGVCHVKLPLFLGADSSNQDLVFEHYSWRKVTTVVNNLIVGKLWVDHLGDMVVKNHRTGEEVTVTFKSKATGGGGGGGGSWFGLGGPTTSSKEDGGAPSDSGELGGFVRDSKGTIRCELKGNWGVSLIAVPVNPIGQGILTRPITLWAREQPPPISPYNFNYTALALTLNDLPATLREYLPLTDSRLRPDQKAMEAGLWEEASKLKEELETLQRTNRKVSIQHFEDTHIKDGPPRENPGLDFGEDWWAPRWFIRETEQDTGEEHWQFTNDYWTYRAQNAANVEQGAPTGSGWPLWVPDIFGVGQDGTSATSHPADASLSKC